MKKILKLTTLLLALVVLAASVCSCTSTSGTKKTIDGDTTDAAGNPVSQELPTITEQKCFEYEGLTVTATALEEDNIFGTGVKLLVENNSAKDLLVGCDALIVNDCMLSDLFSCNIAAGKKANETLRLSSTELEAAGITNIGQIEIYFTVSDAASYETLNKPACVTIKTSAFDTMDATPDDSGHELYNANGIRIVGKYVDEESFWGSSVLLYVENKTEQNITVQSADLSVNGFMVTGLFSSTIYSQKYTIDNITLLSSDLEENGITNIDTVELKFHVFNTETYDTIVDTDAITFNAK